MCAETGEVYTRRGIHMMLSFSDGEMLEASGRVVWSKPLKAPSSKIATPVPLRASLCSFIFPFLSALRV